MPLVRGQVTSGQFKKGYDPRRHHPGRNLVPGTNMTLPELCRIETKRALDVLIRLLKDRKAPIAERRKAAESIIDRGWGKPDQFLKVEADVKEVDLKKLSTTELMALLLERHDDERTLAGELDDEDEDERPQALTAQPGGD